MNIAMIGGRGIPARYGGVERHVEMLSRELAGMGHTVTVYTRRWYYDSSWIAPKHITQVVLPSLHTPYFDTFTHTLLAAVHALFQDVDVIHFHGVGPALLSWIPRLLKPRARVIVTVHSLNRLHPQWNVFGKVVLLLGEWAAAHVPHQTIVVSHHLRAYFRQQYRCDAAMIPNGIEIPREHPSAALLKRWHLASRQYVLFVGRIIESKGVHTLMSAWKELQKKRPEALQNQKLVIVGDAHADRAYGARLRRIAGRDASVVFTGWLEGPALVSLIAHAGLFVQPSETEGMPIALLEAMAYSVPALVSDIPAHRELIREDGMRFPVGDHRALARLMAEAFTDSAWYEKHGRENQELVKREYQWESVAKKTFEIYGLG